MPVADCEIAELRQAYEVLGVPIASSALSIKQAYRRLARRWHPDLYLSNTPAQAQATYMMKLINGAYSRIAHAPLRYHIGSYPEVQEKRSQRARPRGGGTRPGDVEADTLPVTDHVEFWIRFVFGAMFALLMSWRLLFELFEYRLLLTAMTLGLAVGCGLAASRWGEKFWRKLLAWWWLWS